MSALTLAQPGKECGPARFLTGTSSPVPEPVHREDEAQQMRAAQLRPQAEGFGRTQEAEHHSGPSGPTAGQLRSCCSRSEENQDKGGMWLQVTAAHPLRLQGVGGGADHKISTHPGLRERPGSGVP